MSTPLTELCEIISVAFSPFELWGGLLESNRQLESSATRPQAPMIAGALCSVLSPQPLRQTDTRRGLSQVQLNEKIGFKETHLQMLTQAVSIIRLNYTKLPSSWVKEVEYWPPQMVQHNV